MADSTAHPLFDIRYWALLDKIIRAEDQKTRKTWLVPILGRRSILPILSSFIARVNVLQNSELVELVEGLLAMLLPLAAPKAPADQLADCLWSCIHLIASTVSSKEFPALAVRLVTLTIETFNSVVTHARYDKKKVSLLRIVTTPTPA